MPYEIDYTPIGAVGNSAYLSGLGQYNRFQQMMAQRQQMQNQMFQQHQANMAQQQMFALQRYGMQMAFQRQANARQMQIAKEQNNTRLQEAQMRQQGIDRRADMRAKMDAAQLAMDKMRLENTRSQFQQTEADRHYMEVNKILHEHNDLEAQGYAYRNPAAEQKFWNDYEALQKSNLSPLDIARKSLEMVSRKTPPTVMNKERLDEIAQQSIRTVRLDPTDPNSPKIPVQVEKQPSGDYKTTPIDINKMTSASTAASNSRGVFAGWRRVLTDPKRSDPNSPVRIKTLEDAMSAIAQDTQASTELTAEAKEWLMAEKPASGEGHKPPTPEEVMEFKKRMVAAEYGFAEDPGLKRKKVIDELGGIDSLPKNPIRIPKDKSEMEKGQTYALGDGRVAVWTGSVLEPVGRVADGRFNPPPPPPRPGFWGEAWNDAKWAAIKAGEYTNAAQQVPGLVAYGAFEDPMNWENATVSEKVGMSLNPIGAAYRTYRMVRGF